jgi:hypothetical protein
MNKKKYAIWPGYVYSINDEDRHYIEYSQLIMLYNVNPAECFNGRVAANWCGRSTSGIINLRPQRRLEDYKDQRHCKHDLTEA